MLTREHTAIARRRAARTDLERALRSGRAHPDTLERLRRAAYDAGPLDINDGLPVSPLSFGGRAAASAPAPPTPGPPTAPHRFFVVASQNATIGLTKTGTGDSIAAGMTLTDAAGGFVLNDHQNQVLTIAGATTPANNGNYFVSNVPAGTQLTYANASGVAEAYAGAWNLNGKFSSITDISRGLVFSQATPANQPPAVPNVATFPVIGYRPGATVPAMLALSSAPEASVFQGVDISVAIRTNVPGNSPQYFEVGDGTTSNRFLFSLSPANLRFLSVAGGSSSALTCAVNGGSGYPFNTAVTIGFRVNRAAATLSAYTNGVFANTGSAGVVRSPVGLNRIAIGNPHTSGGGNQNIAGICAYNGAWTDAEFLNVHNAFVSYGY